MLLPMRGLPAAPPRPLAHPHTAPAPPPSLLGPRRRRPSRRLSKVVSYYGLTTPPYKTDALEPYMSRRAVELHWGKHQQDYVDGLNKQLAISPLYGHTLEDLIKEAYNNGNPLPEYNDAAEVWNHHFFWESMQPEGGGSPEAGVLQQIEKDFGSFFNFREEFMRSAMSLLGSGWVWLVLKRSERKLEVVHTRNAINPLAFGDIPIISLDLWEHAYYLDYKDDRRTYVSNFLDHLVSWHTVTLRMMRAEAFVNLGEPTIPVA
ncbi:superoxide dismutase [Fe] 2, chloroplastic-like [Triticum dicoccoides]|uniref:superoxide dismutase [Fe] 2, chloroplastic-like n=1 Tax=Triticum dicoccoides TaxID=85692 RepID=UPI001890B7D1|nr:superoxide dismutase [Fe] 2, chloroplastic-like [Triticum dicoccoides]